MELTVNNKHKIELKLLRTKMIETMFNSHFFKYFTLLVNQANFKTLNIFSERVMELENSKFNLNVSLNDI